MQIKLSSPSFNSKGLTPTPAKQQVGLDGQDEGRTSNVLEQRKEQLHDMQAAVTKLQELTSPKKQASQRAALLKQSLDILKSILAKLPPGDYKALVQELKQIAKELAALSRTLGNSGSSLSHMPPMATTTGETQTDGSEDMADVGTSTEPANRVQDTDSAELATPADAELTAETAQAEARQAATLSAEVERDLNANDDEAHDAKTSMSRIANLRQNEDADDKALRAILTEASKTLKEVLSLLKAKHQVDDKESRKLFASIERDLETLEQSLQQEVFPSSISAAVSAETTSCGMGGLINVSV